jgi:hypothetical protein
MSEDVTAVMRRHSTSKLLSTLIGLIIALCSAAGSYYAYRQAKLEARTESSNVRGEAAVGYRTLADPVELAVALVKTHDARIQALEVQMRELKTRQSIPIETIAPPSLGLVPLDRAKLFRPLPKTLGEANAMAK